MLTVKWDSTTLIVIFACFWSVPLLSLGDNCVQVSIRCSDAAQQAKYLNTVPNIYCIPNNPLWYEHCTQSGSATSTLESHYPATFGSISAPIHLNQKAELHPRHVRQDLQRPGYEPFSWFRCVRTGMHANNSTFVFRTIPFIKDWFIKISKHDCSFATPNLKPLHWFIIKYLQLFNILSLTLDIGVYFRHNICECKNRKAKDCLDTILGEILTFNYACNILYCLDGTSLHPGV